MIKVNIKTISTLLLFFKSFTGLSQNIDSVNIEKADMVVKRYFNETTSSYILYNLDYKYIIVTKGLKSYKLYFVGFETGIEDSLNIDLRNKTLRQAFNPNSCNKKFLYSSCDLKGLETHPHSKYIYYVLKHEGTKLCEFSLPTLFNTSVRDTEIYPLNEVVQKFFLQKLFAHWKE